MFLLATRDPNDPHGHVDVGGIYSTDDRARDATQRMHAGTQVAIQPIDIDVDMFPTYTVNTFTPAPPDSESETTP